MSAAVDAEFADWLDRFERDCGRKPTRAEQMAAYGALARREEWVSSGRACGHPTESGPCDRSGGHPGDHVASWYDR